jgi:hypothetical protein
MAIMQPKTNHFLWTKEETVVQLNGTGPGPLRMLSLPMTPERNKAFTNVEH